MFARGVDTGKGRRKSMLYLLCLGIMVVSGIFTVIALYYYTGVWQRTRITEPYQWAEWQEVKNAYRETPDDDQLVQELRELDVQLRHVFFHDRGMLWTGRWLIILGSLLFLSAAKVVGEYHRTPNLPQLMPNMEVELEKRSQRAMWAASIVSLAVGVGAGWLAVVHQDAELTAAADKAGDQDAAPRSEFPTAAETAKAWGTFRGPGGSGVSAYTNVPTKFNGKMGQSVLWRAQLPLPGKSSPVVWGDRVFVTGANKKKREVWCFETKKGKLLWTANVAPPNPRGKTAVPDVHEDTGYAAPTCATDGRRVVAIFANYDIVCLDYKGKELWARPLGGTVNMYGHSASLVIHKDRVLLQLDQGTLEEKKSRLMALNVRDGKTLWKVERPVGDSWPSPILIKAAGKDQLITCANPWVISYDPQTGKELWRCDGLEGDGGPSPIFAGGLVLAANVDSYINAIKPDGTGDVTKTHIAWRSEDGLPDICSPVSNGELLFSLANGILACIDMKDGKMLWEHDYEAEFTTSPSIVGDKVMLVTKTGDVKLCAAAREFKEVGAAVIGERCEASPAFADGRMYFRGAKKYLYCFGEAGK